MMAQAIVKGVFMGAHLKESNFEGVKKVSCMIDVYQPTSQAQDKMVSVKCDDATRLTEFNTKFCFGDLIDLEVLINAYRNEAYYKLSAVIG